MSIDAREGGDRLGSAGQLHSPYCTDINEHFEGNVHWSVNV